MPECKHENIWSLSDGDDHVVLCRDCRSVTHWCNVEEDEWREFDRWREAQKGGSIATKKMATREQVEFVTEQITKAVIKAGPKHGDYGTLYDVRRALLWVLDPSSGSPSTWCRVERILAQNK